MNKATEVIPKEVWKKFDEYWNKTNYEKLKPEEIKKLLGKNLFIPLPKDVTDRKVIDIWYNSIKELKEKAKPFGGLEISFKGDSTPLKEVFGEDPISPAIMNSKMWSYIKSKKGEK